MKEGTEIDVFISHSYRDQETASAARLYLEHEGFRCWKAPEDIPPGQPWEASIVSAIDQAYALLLIWTKHSQNSQQVQRELSIASATGTQILPIKLEPIIPDGVFRYYLTGTHWIETSKADLLYIMPRISDTVNNIKTTRPVKSRIQKQAIKARGLEQSDKPHRESSCTVFANHQPELNVKALDPLAKAAKEAAHLILDYVSKFGGLETAQKHWPVFVGGLCLTIEQKTTVDAIISDAWLVAIRNPLFKNLLLKQSQGVILVDISGYDRMESTSLGPNTPLSGWMPYPGQEEQEELLADLSASLSSSQISAILMLLTCLRTEYPHDDVYFIAPHPPVSDLSDDDGARVVW